MILALINAEPRALDKLPRDIYDELLRIAHYLPQLKSAKSVLRVCRAAAADVGLPSKVLYRRVLAWIETGDWRCLIDRRRCAFLWDSRDAVGLPEAFKEFYRGLREKHQRVATSAHRELLLIWRQHTDAAGNYHTHIPGYGDTWPAADARTGIPTGWTYENLQQAVPEDAYDTKAARLGMFAASEYRPPVRTTRVGLKLGERVEFDDHEFDKKTHFPGQPKAMRPFCFGGVEGLSSFADLCIRPVFWDAETETKKKFTEFQFRCFVVHWLMTHGYRADGTTLYTERGTAVIREDFARLLYTLSGGAIRVAQGSVFGAAAHPGQFTPRGKGNFKHKPQIEGLWSILENWLDRLPGQTGSNARLNGPAELHGREDYLQRVLKQAARLPQDQAENLLLPVLTFHQFSRLAFEEMNTWLSTTDHELEGWDQLGYAVSEWRPDERALGWYGAADFARLPEAEQQVLARRLADPALQLTRARRLSRREVWDQQRGELVRFAPRQLHRLFPLTDGIEVTVSRQHLIEFTDREKFGPGEFRFLARDKHHGDALPGEKYLAFFNPLDPRWLNCCRADGAHVALYEAWDMPGRNDIEAVKRQMGRQSEWEATRRQRIAGRHFDTAETRAHMIEHNRAVISGNTDEEKTRARFAQVAGDCLNSSTGETNGEREPHIDYTGF
jgi:hypothetical protein